MLIYLLAILWIFGGCYCATVNWTQDLDLKGKDIIPTLLAGVTIGPILGLIDCITALCKFTMGRLWNKIFIKARA